MSRRIDGSKRYDRKNTGEIAYLEEGQAEMFKSDFKYVADYFIQRRKDKRYVPALGTVRHVHETLELLNALTHRSVQ